MGRIFGTDGVRGVANTEISCKLAMDVARAAAMVVTERIGRKPRFLIGMDTRISSDMLCAAMSAGLCSVGADVVQVGVVPTPAVAYLVKSREDLDAGIMLSASHNPYEYNGIKIFGSEGFKLTDEQEFEIEEIVLDHVKPYSICWGGDLGRITRDDSLLQCYIDHIASTVQGDLSGLKIAVDCSNGSASATAAQIFQKLHGDVTLFHREPNGTNINLNCGSTHIEDLAKRVKEGGYDVGVAFDGDADRCIMVDEQGQVVDGDRIIAVLSKHMQEQGTLAQNSAVVTVMSNMGFFKFCEKNGISSQITKVGDRYLLERMLQCGYNIGGEQSGHVILLDHMPTGDGQLTAVQMLQTLKASGQTMSALASVMEVYPQVNLSVRADNVMKSRLGVDEGLNLVIQEQERLLGDEGRVLVRASGTEPVIRVMVEGKDQELIGACAQKIAQTIEERLANNESCKQLEEF